MRRTFAALLLSAAMVCSILAGCSSSGPASSTPSTSKPSNDTSTTTPPGGNNSNSNNNNNNNNSTTKPDNSDNSGSTLPSIIPKVVYNSTYSYQEDKYYQNFSCFTITNPNTVNDFTWGTITVTYKDADGKTVGTGRKTLPPIAAGDTVTYTTWLTTVDVKPESCSFTYDFPVSGVLVHSNTTVAKQSDLVVSDAARNETYCAEYTCKVKNNSSISMKHVIVHLYYVKDGKTYPAGNPNYIYDLAPGKTQSCKIPISYSGEMKDYDSFKLIANQWY